MKKDIVFNEDVAQSKILTVDNFDYFDQVRAVTISSEGTTGYYIKLFERVSKSFENVGSTWLLQAPRSGQTATLIDINMRVESDVSNPTLRVVCDKYSPLINAFDVYYKKASNDVYEFYIKLNNPYTELHFTNLHHTRLIDVNKESSQTLTPPSDLILIPKTNRCNIVYDELTFKPLGEYTIANNSSLHLGNLINIQLTFTFSSDVPNYTFLASTENNIQVTRDFYTTLYNPSNSYPCQIKANTNGVIISTGGTTIPAGTYQVNFVTKVKTL